MNSDKNQTYLNILKMKNPALYKASIAALSERESSNTIFTTTVLAVAPLLFTYITWVLTEAKNKQIKRLYFLARDGYVMKAIADRICEQNKIDIECKYLYSSRIAWRIPGYHLEKEKCLDKICINSVEVNLDKIFDRAKLTAMEREEVSRLLNANEQEKKRHLLWHELLEYKEKLSNCAPFLQYVYEHSEKAYEATQGYFKQEGLYDNIKYAVVDTGWTGSMQTSLACLLNRKRMEGFYFGIYNLPQGANQDDFHSFHFSKDKGLKNKVYFNNNLFECICSAPDGMTIGYAKANNKYVPVFASEKNSNMDSWDLELQIKTIIRFAEIAVKQEHSIEYNHKKSKELAHLLCKEFMVYPTCQEAESYGNYRFSDDVTEKHMNKLAVDMTVEEIKQNFIFSRIANKLKIKKYNVPYKQSCWIDASIVKCNDAAVEKYIRRIILFRWAQYIYMKYSNK